MKIKLPRPSPAMAVALVALVLSLGGTASAFVLGRDSVHSANLAPGAVRASDLGRLTLRSAKVRDTDGTPNDGQFNLAFGQARCKAGERLIGGGTRAKRAPLSGPVRIVLVEQGLVPRENEYAALWHSDLGGAARQDFAVFAYCLSR
jgi:hypothetical protein